MSAVGVGLTVAANAAIIGGAGFGAKWLADNWGKDEANAASQASNVQQAGARQGIGTLREGVATARSDVDPYAQAGTNALRMQQALAGSLGPEAQAQAYAAIEQSPAFAAMLQQGEEAMLANAAATGGLRGGNTQAALANFRPQLLQALIQQQYGQLAGLSSQGLGAASQQAGYGMQGAGVITGLQQDAAAYKAGGILGSQAARTAARQQLLQYGMQAGGAALQMGMGMPPTALAGGGAPAPAPMMQQPMGGDPRGWY